MNPGTFLVPNLYDMIKTFETEILASLIQMQYQYGGFPIRYNLFSVFDRHGLKREIVLPPLLQNVIMNVTVYHTRYCNNRNNNQNNNISIYLPPFLVESRRVGPY